MRDDSEAQLIPAGFRIVSVLGLQSQSCSAELSGQNSRLSPKLHCVSYKMRVNCWCVLFALRWRQWWLILQSTTSNTQFWTTIMSQPFNPVVLSWCPGWTPHIISRVDDGHWTVDTESLTEQYAELTNCSLLYLFFSLLLHPLFFFTASKTKWQPGCQAANKQFSQPRMIPLRTDTA